MYALFLFFIASINVTLYAKLNFDFPSFYSSMEINGNKLTYAMIGDRKIRLNKQLYENYVRNISTQKSKSIIRIPKIIHQIWLGGEIPEQYRLWGKTFVDKNPGWQYILWDERALERFGLVNQKLFDKAEKYAFKADIARYEILYRLGGIYFDTDIECMQSLDFLCYCDFFGACDPDAIRIQNCVIGACPQHPILKSCIDFLSEIPINSKDTTSRWKETGPDLLTKSFYQFAFLVDKTNDKNLLVIFPTTFFFPLSKHERFAEASSTHPIVKGKIRPETLAIHYWHTSWIGPMSLKP